MAYEAVLERGECSIARALEVVGERWTLLVLREAFQGVRRFEEMQRHLGIARNILTDRLNRLVDAEVLGRHQYQDRPVRFEYRLTAKGRDLWPVMISLLQWGDRWEAPTVALHVRHRRCGHAAGYHLACQRCGERVGSIRDVSLDPVGAS